MSESTDYLKRQPQLEQKESLKDGEDLLTVILAPIAALGFGKFQVEVQNLDGDVAEQFGKQLRTFALSKERIPGHVITRDSHYSIEGLNVIVADASIQHALNAYNAAQKKPLDPKAEQKRLENDGFPFSIVQEHGCEQLFNHLVGKCGFEYVQSASRGKNGEISFILGEPLSRDPEDEDAFATCIVLMLSMQGQQ